MLCATLAAVALLAPAVRADALDPEFYKTDWTKTCASGTAQTPIDLESVASVPMPAELVTTFKFPTVTGVKLKNTGTALKVRRLRAVTAQSASWCFCGALLSALRADHGGPARSAAT